MDLIKKRDDTIKAMKEIVFSEFSYDTAWKIGSLLYEKAKSRKLPVVISISLNRQNMFYAALEGTSSTNEDWVGRKENVVYKFLKSSFEMRLSAEIDSPDENFLKVNGLSHKEYALSGGSVPILIKGVGTVGAITVSGLPDEEDHNLVIEAIKEYLK